MGRLDSAIDFIRRITVWLEHLGRYPDEALSRDLAALIMAWYASLLLAAPAVVATWRVFRKAGEPGWAAIVPVYNIIVLATR